MRWSRRIHAALTLPCTSGRHSYHAVQVFQTGGPKVLQLCRNLPSKPVTTNEVRVSIQKIGVNYHDTYTRTGLYPLPLPFVVGCEAAGDITEVGDGVDDLTVGDRVAFFQYNAGYATEAVVPRESCFLLGEVSYELGAASLVQGLTAHYLAHDSFNLGPHHTCLVHAAGGGTGNLLVQMAKIRGTTVIATSSPGPKARAATKAGADHVVTYGDDYDFLSSVRNPRPEGVDVVYDSIRKATSEASLLCLKPRGTCVMYGNSSGPPNAILPTPTLAASSLHVHRPVLQHFLMTPEERTKRASDLFGWIEQGKLTVRISQTFSLQDASDAHVFLESRKALGKVLLDPLVVDR